MYILYIQLPHQYYNPTDLESICQKAEHCTEDLFFGVVNLRYQTSEGQPFSESEIPLQIILTQT